MSSLPVLVLNSGSSSIKFSMYEAGDGQRTQALRRRGRRHRHRSRQVLDQGRATARSWSTRLLRCPTAPSHSSWSPMRCTPASSLPQGHRTSHGLRRPDGAREPAHHSRADRRDGTLHGVCAAAHAHRRLHHARGAAALSRRSQLRRFSIPTSIAPCRKSSRACRFPTNMSAMGVRRYG